MVLLHTASGVTGKTVRTTHLVAIQIGRLLIAT
jgi:hypothetical protein